MKQNQTISVRTIKQLQANQEKAFDKIYNAYKDKFYFMAYNFFKNEADAEDIVQEIFIKILQNIKTLNNPEVFHVWVHRLAYHTCINAIAKSTMKVKGNYNSLEIEEYEDTKAININNQIIHKEMNDLILEIVQNMPITLRYVTLLRFYQQFSIAEIADILDISENAVKLRISRARSYIKKALEAQGIAPEVINSAMDPKALFLLFMSMESIHTLSLTSESVIVSQAVTQAGHSPTTLAIVGAVATVFITGTIIYTNSQPKNEQASIPQTAIEESHIIDINYPQDYTNQGIELNVKTTNQNYDYIAINNQNTTIIGENGTYTVSLIKDDKVIDSQNITINNIDIDSPVKKSIKKNGNQYIFSFEDNLSMVDQNQIEVYQNKQKITSYQFDIKTQSLYVTIDPQYIYHIIIRDKAGNKTYITSKTN